MDREKLDALYRETVSFFAGHPKQIQHFIKVHSLAAFIGRQERVPEEVLFSLEAAALVHDVGILPAIEKYGSGSGKLQEQEGPPVARRLLSSLSFPEEVVARVESLVGRHHTYDAIEGEDYQILVEADFLVNFYESNTPRENIAATAEKIFRTKTGKALLADLFLVPPPAGRQGEK